MKRPQATSAPCSDQAKRFSVRAVRDYLSANGFAGKAAVGKNARPKQRTLSPKQRRLVRRWLVSKMIAVKMMLKVLARRMANGDADSRDVNMFEDQEFLMSVLEGLFLSAALPYNDPKSIPRDW